MLRQKKQTRAARGCPKAAAVFDPVAYAASIAISAAEKRLRAPHVRGASSSTARPSSPQRPLRKGALDEAPEEAAVASSHTASASVLCRSVFPELTASAEGPRTLLEELACASDSSMSVIANTPPMLTCATPHNHTPVDASRSASVRSLSPPAPPTPNIPRYLAHLATRTESPPSEQEEAPTAEINEDDDGTVSLRDASPLREHSVPGSVSIRYHTCTMESVHSIVRQLNFSLYK
ncbi:hypothetical protein CGC21_5645 [Leishmania donovani]|uniref:Uncharacterized protein n=1 Tax=Leishmania donovani TaxID=5661 RepID=A0A504X5J3_LEIDO|nr:hypothetical protein CGC21_5645 [Leishmania donovani]